MSFLSVSFPHGAQLEYYPALSVGLVVFTFGLLVLDAGLGGAVSGATALYPLAPTKFDLNALSLYLLFHQGILHWLFNVVSLWTPLCLFERAHGTVYTGITLNLLAVTAALQYCVLGVMFFPDTKVIGLSGVVFSLVTYYAFLEHQRNPVLHRFAVQGRQVEVPTLATPFIALVVCAVVVPGSSFMGHAAGISSGFLLAKGYLKVLYPPSKVILAIESKLDRVIQFLNTLVTYIKEEDAVELRNVGYTPILAHDVEAASLATPTFNESNVLGTN